MSQYYGQGRSNTFAVKDLAEFETEMKKYETVEVVADKETGLVTLYPRDSVEGGFPWDYLDDETDDFEEIPWEEIFKKHLQDDWVVIVMESGSHKLRYIGGCAYAWNNKGETREIDISEIENLAKEIGTKGTEF